MFVLIFGLKKLPYELLLLVIAWLMYFFWCTNFTNENRRCRLWKPEILYPKSPSILRGSLVDRLLPKHSKREPVWPEHTWRKEQVSTFIPGRFIGAYLIPIFDNASGSCKVKYSKLFQCNYSKLYNCFLLSFGHYSPSPCSFSWPGRILNIQILLPPSPENKMLVCCRCIVRVVSKIGFHCPQLAGSNAYCHQSHGAIPLHHSDSPEVTNARAHSTAASFPLCLTLVLGTPG